MDTSVFVCFKLCLCLCVMCMHILYTLYFTIHIYNMNFIIIIEMEKNHGIQMTSYHIFSSFWRELLFVCWMCILYVVVYSILCWFYTQLSYKISSIEADFEWQIASNQLSDSRAHKLNDIIQTSAKTLPFQFCRNRMYIHIIIWAG